MSSTVKSRILQFQSQSTGNELTNQTFGITFRKSTSPPSYNEDKLTHSPPYNQSPAANNNTEIHFNGSNLRKQEEEDYTSMLNNFNNLEIERSNQQGNKPPLPIKKTSLTLSLSSSLNTNQ